jgi:hypothetical protein
MVQDRLIAVTRQRYLLPLLLACGSLWIAGCMREQAVLSSDAEAATRQINRLVPKGTPVARAKKILANKGFTLSRMESAASENHLLVATYYKQNHTWVAGFVIVDGRVIATSVSVTEG